MVWSYIIIIDVNIAERSVRYHKQSAWEPEHRSKLNKVAVEKVHQYKILDFNQIACSETSEI